MHMRALSKPTSSAKDQTAVSKPAPKDEEKPATDTMSYQQGFVSGV